MDMGTALAIMAKSRLAFTNRTTNKLFDKSNSDPTAFPDTPEAIQAARKRMEAEALSAEIDSERKRELDKAIARNKVLEANDLERLREKNPEGYCPYIWGKKMYRRSLEQTKASGNCHELASVAVYLSHHAGESKRETYLVKVDPPGDHGFCIVGAKKKPSWTTVASMSNDETLASIIVIDPWMKLACYANLYPQIANHKMQEWLRRGKRIFWGGNDQKTKGWYQPGGDYLARFLDSKLKYEAPGGYY